MSHSPISTTRTSAAEAARYALTRRLLPVLRHHMVVHLQPIGMIYEVLERKLDASQPDMAAVREGLAKINTLSRSAIRSSLDVVTWLAPDPAAVAGLGEGTRDSLEVLASNFRFRGFKVSNEVGDAALPVSQAAVREVLTAALLAATDSAPGGVDLLLALDPAHDSATLSIQVRHAEGSDFAAEMPYRAMQWDDVQALADGHQVQLAVEGTRIRLTFPSARAPSAA